MSYYNDKCNASDDFTPTMKVYPDVDNQNSF